MGSKLLQIYYEIKINIIYEKKIMLSPKIIYKCPPQKKHKIYSSSV